MHPTPLVSGAWKRQLPTYSGDEISPCIEKILKNGQSTHTVTTMLKTAFKCRPRKLGTIPLASVNSAIFMHA